MADVQITCVTKPDRNSTHDQITHVGGPGGGGWKWPAEDVVASIDRPAGPTGRRLPARAWVDDFIEQVAAFPMGAPTTTWMRLPNCSCAGTRGGVAR